MTPPRLPDFALETYFSRWQFAAEHNLTASDAESMTVSGLLAMGAQTDRSRFEQLHLGYTPTWGTDEVRDTIAASYSGVGAPDVLGFAGAGEALFWAMQLFVDPGAHVIVTAPNYQSIESIPLASGVEVSGLPLWTGAGGHSTWIGSIRCFDRTPPSCR